MPWGSWVFPSRALLICLLGGYLAGCSLAARAANKAGEKEDSVLPPSVRLPVEPLGFQAPGALYAMRRVSYASLDFVDNDHLLFTFHKAALLKRLPDRTSKDDDQMIQAVVLEISTGRVTAQTEWRMRDRGRYLWNLGNGQFLVRQRNVFSLTDKSLVLHPHFVISDQIESVQLGLGGRYLVVETRKPKEEREERDLNTLTSKDLSEEVADYTVWIVRVQDRRVVSSTPAKRRLFIPMNREGLIFAQQVDKSRWDIRLRNLHSADAVALGSVTSNCFPQIHPLSDKRFLAITCDPASSDHVGVVMDAGGVVLWSHRWDGRYVWPFITANEEGKKVAIETLVMDRPFSSVNLADPENVMEQRVEVFDIDTGKSQLSLSTHPILDAGQNVAFSADGTRVAVLRNQAIEVYPVNSAGQ